MANIRPESEALVEEVIAQLELEPSFELDPFLACHEEFADEVRGELVRMAERGLLRLPGPRGPVAKQLSKQFDYREESEYEPSRGLPSEIIDDRFEVFEEVGRGGMSRVVRAFDRNLSRDVALKLALLPAREEADSRRTWVQRFIAEARINGQLEHPGIAPVHEVGVSADGRIWFAMKLVRGRSLLHLIEGFVAKSAEPNSEFSIGQLVDMALKLCDALAFAHARGVVHGDIKPSNVMVGSFGEVQLMDWGLAHRAGKVPPEWVSLVTNHGEQGKTASGAVFGTPSYMAPEQARGETARIGTHTDIFGLGALCAHLFAGSPPYHGKDLEEVLGRAREGRRNDPSLLRSTWAVPKELRGICNKALAPKIDERYASIESMARDLRAFREDRVGSAWADSVGQKLRKYVRRHPLLTTTVGASLVIALVAALSIIAIQNSNRQLKLEQTAKAGLERSLAAESKAAREATRANEAEAQARRFQQILYEPRRLLAKHSVSLVEKETDYGAQATELVEWLESVGFDLASPAQLAAAFEALETFGAESSPDLKDSIRTVHRELVVALIQGGFAAAACPDRASEARFLGESNRERQLLMETYARNAEAYPEMVDAWHDAEAAIDTFEDSPWRRRAWAHLLMHVFDDPLWNASESLPGSRSPQQRAKAIDTDFTELVGTSFKLSLGDANWLGRLRGLQGGNRQIPETEALALAHPGSHVLQDTAARLRLYDYGWHVGQNRFPNSALLRKLQLGVVQARGALALQPDSLKAHVQYADYLLELSVTYLILADEFLALSGLERDASATEFAARPLAEQSLYQLSTEYRLAAVTYQGDQLNLLESLFESEQSRLSIRPRYVRALAQYAYQFKNGFDLGARERVTKDGLPTAEQAEALAVELAEAEVDANPDGPYPRAKLAEMYTLVGRFEDAVEVIEIVIEDYPEEKQFKALAIQAYLRLSRTQGPQGARDSKERAIELFELLPPGDINRQRAKIHLDQFQ